MTSAGSPSSRWTRAATRSQIHRLVQAVIRAQMTEMSRRRRGTNCTRSSSGPARARARPMTRQLVNLRDHLAAPRPVVR